MDVVGRLVGCLLRFKFSLLHLGGSLFVLFLRVGDVSLVDFSHHLYKIFIIWLIKWLSLPKFRECEDWRSRFSDFWISLVIS